MNLDTILNNPYFIQFIIWSGLGLVVGVVAKLLLPGSENMGWIRTILVGLAGCFLGNKIAPQIFNLPVYPILSWQGLGLSIVAALALVIVNRLVTKS